MRFLFRVCISIAIVTVVVHKITGMKRKSDQILSVFGVLCCIILLYYGLIDNRIICIKEEPKFYYGEVQELQLRNHSQGGRLYYDITLNTEKNGKAVFEKIYVPKEIKIGDKIEICYNPTMEGIVAKVNGVEMAAYKYEYKLDGPITQSDVKRLFVKQIIFFSGHFLLFIFYVIVQHKNKKTKWCRIFCGMWLFGWGMCFILTMLTIKNIIDYYSFRVIIACSFYVFMLGEFFYALDVEGFQLAKKNIDI